jgi:hypothetical protein
MALVSFLASRIEGSDRRELHQRSGPAEHTALVHMLANQLQAEGWKVNEEPLISTVRPDLIATKEGKAPHVFEIKTGSAHLGAVAQVEAYRNALSAQSSERPTAVLVVLDEAPSELEDAARRAGVELWRISAGDPADTVASLDPLISRA